ncbi:hypothetical protein [uncultured Flavonifractor sp.]|uniref:hypothetical protein n=1 Tax=uncultured Flavonifractor sp. TaxID=1193534 RepID=UPI0026328AB4|nr:hypothetical protein [uncultured Flavonifractor sp.]
MNSKDYRSTLGGVTPSPAWRQRTLVAMKAAQGQKEPRRKPLAIAATAAVLALAVTGGVWLSNRTEVDPNGPGTARTPEPVVTPTPSAAPIGTDSERFFIVTDPSQLIGNNPTAGHLYELTALPVYENPIPTEAQQRALLNQLVKELGYTIAETQWSPGCGEETMNREPILEAECTDGTMLRLRGVYSLDIYDSPDLAAVAETVQAILIYNSMTTEEMLSSVWMGPEVRQEDFGWYDFTGTLQTLQATSLLDPDATLEEQIYSYSFQRMELRNDTLTLYLQPGESVGTYPLRSPDDAQASFRAGDYWGSDQTFYPEEAQIIFVSLEYDISVGQPYFQPVYRILFVQSYWDMADRMFDGVDPSPFMGVGIAYVPAIDPEYQDEVPYRRYFNDGLAHHTPEELT